MLGNYECYEQREQRKGTGSVHRGCSFNSMVTVGLEGKLKVIVMAENWFLELIVFLGEDVPCHSLLCQVWGLILDHYSKCNHLL